MGAPAEVDEAVWGRLEEIIKAAHNHDKDNFVRLSQSFASDVELAGHQRMGLYLWYLLRHAVAGLAGGRVPADAELERISYDYVSSFQSLVVADRITLEDTFRKVFERRPLAKDIGPGGLLFLGPAALGVIYDHPESELSIMKVKLGLWLRAHADSLSSRGLLK